ncbi:MAG: hypothetical protein PVF22_04170 [Candidatus Aminicenantes bacterium]
MVCPKCACEYTEGIKVCVDCHVLLVNNSPQEFFQGNGNGRLVHFITYLTRQEAESGKKLLETNRVEALVSMDEIQGVRLWIHKEDAQKAVQVFQAKAAAEKKSKTPH